MLRRVGFIYALFINLEPHDKINEFTFGSGNIFLIYSGVIKPVPTSEKILDLSKNFSTT